MDKIQRDFLNQIQVLIEKVCPETFADLERQFEKELPEITLSLTECMERLLTQYHSQEERGENGVLAWVYISYLRSGILTHNACLKIDCYDTRDRISSVECTEYWDCSLIWELYYKFCHELEVKFDSQTRVRKYELDYIRLRLADRYFNLTREIIPKVLQAWLDECGLQVLGGRKVTFMMGEFLDSVNFVMLWDSDHIKLIQEDTNNDHIYEELNL